MVEFRETVTVAAAVTEVAQVLHAVERWPSWTSSSLGVRSTGEHWAQEAGDGRTLVTLTLSLSGPLARITATVYARLIRRYVRMEADGLRHEVERPSAGR